MRDKRPDPEDPHFQRVPGELEPTERESQGWRFLAATVLFATPFAVIAALVIEWPDPRVEQQVAVAPPPAPAPAVPQEPSPVAALQAAQAEVLALQAELYARTTELGTLRSKQDIDDVERAKQEAVIEREVARLQAAVRTARGDRDELRTQLQAALADLDREVGAHEQTKREQAALTRTNAENVWVAFTQRAKIDICEQFTASGRERCRSRLDDWFDDRREARFTQCVEDSRTIPSTWRVDPHATLPPNAEVLTMGTRTARDDWYVLYCDPTLPEAQLADSSDDAPPVFHPTAP